MEDKFSAYRKRKKEYIKNLESRVKELEDECRKLYHENQELKSQIHYLEITKRR
jgi:superoxide dismutase